MTVNTPVSVTITRAFLSFGTLGEFYREWTDHGYDASLIQHDCDNVIARIDSRIVGALQLIVIRDPYFNRKWGLVENVYVTPSARGLGVATQLMQTAEMSASLLGCEFIKLTSRKDDGKALYRSLGYEESSSFRKELNG